MVADEIEQSDDVVFSEAVDRIDAQPEGTLIEFFGGEPTIYPRFLDLLRHARQRGHRCSIASNIRIFHNWKFTRSVAELDASKIYIRTSIYGDTPDVHDYYTAATGSFAQTVQGIANIVAEGFLCQVNVVIMKRNYESLPSIVRAVHEWGVPRIKFGNLMGVDSCADHAVALVAVRPHLCEAVAVAEDLGLTVTVEKTPVCVAGGRLDLMSTESVLYGSERAYDDAGECGGCLVRPWCEGMDRGYADRFGPGGLQRLETVPASIVKPPPHESRDPELLKMYCVEIPDAPPDRDTLVELERVWTRVSARHGRLAIFPSRYLRKVMPVTDADHA
jgi:pyruvate-formate lyase-activating enzyme